MKVLITGSSSYIGRNLIQKLEEKKKKFKYIGIDRNKKLNKNCRVIDINNKNLDKLIKKKIDIIVHLAAVSSHQQSIEEGSKVYDINIRGLVNIIKFAKKKKVRKFILISTEWVYENNSNNLTIDPSLYESEYSLTKYIAENILKKTKGITNIILRLGIVYGNNPKYSSTIDKICKDILDKKKIKVGSLKTARKYLHVLDVVDAILQSLKLNESTIIDIQGQKLINFKKILNTFSKIINKKIDIKEINPNKFSIRKQNKILKNKNFKWRPKIDISTGLKMIYENYKKKQNM